MPQSLTLAAGGQSALRIDVTPDQWERLAFAADELQRYLAILTGAWLEVTSDAPPGPALRLALEPEDRECHGWRTDASGVTLYGDCPLSVLHAVYAFLEQRAGCEWRHDFEGGEVIPRLERLEVPLEEQSFSPAFTHRAFTNYPDIDRRTVSMVDWMAKQRFNRFMVFANMGDSFARYQQVLQRELAGRNMPVELGHHSFRFFLPPAEFFATHPEYYAELQGQRSPDGQLCTSHPAVAELVAQRVSACFAAHPEIDTIGLWPNDGYGWCQCADCLTQEAQESSWPYADHPRRTDTYLRFVNAVAEVVAREFPDRRLSALAYVNYVQPPRQVLPAPNVKVCFAPFQRCLKHPLAAPPECTRRNADYAALLAQWRSLVPGALYLFEYLMEIDLCSLPYRLENLLPGQAQHYAALGVQGYVLEFKPEEWGLYGVNAHLLGRLSWDPHLPAEEFLAGHYARLYGPAAQAMGCYFRELRRLLVDLGPCVGHYDLTHTRRATERLLRPAAEHLGRAVARVAGGEARHREQVRAAQAGFQLLLRLGHWQRLMAVPERQPEAVTAGEEILRWAAEKTRRDLLDAPRLELVISRELRRGPRGY